ncbi:Hypothetical predicted protein [Mytilus galloprovincialis]|uniref:Reverse transcriptase domain-containing protein n=1 Tax=Mytilus galloprovincialis TaxID=29158 RepID=A0A8B6HNR4_MYTGA|nr:Hypothetical predicted protein [Mytilus galloprovincialis]
MSNRKRSLRKRDKKKRLIKYKSKLRIHNNNKGHLKRTKHFHENVKKALNYIEVFSRENLTNYEILVLAKGLKFIPSPDVKYIKQNLLRDFDELGRKMRCKYHFSDKTNADTNHPFRIKSGFKPSLHNNTIENYLFATKMEICRLKINKVRNNLSKHERAALKTLRSNNNIIIKKADKNSSTVVLDKNLYIKQTLNFLNNSICYEQIHEFNTNKISETIQKMIKQLHKKEYIDDITYKYLANNANIRVGRLYMLPKIHKINHEDREKIKTNKDFLKNIDIPGRPIVSLCNSPIEKIGQFIDHFLKPVVSQLWTYTQDTTSFINKIEQIRAPDDIIMCTFDITSMYNSLTHDEILQAVDRAWYKICRNKHEIPLPPKKDFLRILQFILCNNEFEFNNLIFRQTCGIPMGAPMSPSLADLRMFEIITNILDIFPFKDNLALLSIYRDDGFILFNSSQDNLTELFNIANNIHPLIKFTHEISQSSIQFLDVTIFKGNRFLNHKYIRRKTIP